MKNGIQGALDEESRRMTRYSSYLLRIWGQDPDSVQEWRATLESTASHCVHCFSSMQLLTDFLSGLQDEVGPDEQNCLSPCSDTDPC